MKVTVAVLFGGKSVEHEVSIITGMQAFAALDSAKYDALPIYIDKNNAWYTGSHMGDIESYKNMSECMKKATRVIPVSHGGRVSLVRFPMKMLGSNVVGMFDVALPAVHGTHVEDGTLMGMLEMLGVPYAGCDVTASAIGMDKFAMKAVLRQAGLPVLDALCYSMREYVRNEAAIIAKIEAEIGYPAIVKPVNLGSSVGISFVSNADELKKAMDLGFEYAQRILVEKAVQNLREINCSVLGDIDDAEASVCEEPVTSNEILDFSDKYVNNSGKIGGSKSGMSSLKRRLPADIPDEMTECIRQLALDTFKAIGCAGVSRIDFLNNTETGELYVNEINTIPGSLSFYLWQESGVDFTQLMTRLVELALKRKRDRESLVFSYDSNILAGVSLGGTKGSKI